MASSHQQKTSVYVRAPPIESDTQQSTFCDKLCIYFQKKRVSKDSDVKEVCVLSSDDEALWLRVTFSEPSGVDAVLSKEQHELLFETETVSLHVQSFYPEKRNATPPLESDSDFEVLTSDSWRKQDDESGANANDRPHHSLSSRHEGNPIYGSPTGKSQQAGSHETATYTPHQVKEPLIPTPTCLAHSMAPSPTAPATAPQSTTPVEDQSSRTSQRASSMPSTALSVPPTASTLPSTVSFTTHPYLSSINKGAPGVRDYQTPQSEIMASFQQNTQSQDVTQMPNTSVSTRSSIAGMFTETTEAPGNLARLWHGFDPGISLNNSFTQPPPGFGFPSVGRGRGILRGSTSHQYGHQYVHMPVFQPTQGLPYGTPTRFSMPEAGGHFDPSSAKDTTAPSSQSMGLIASTGHQHLCMPGFQPTQPSQGLPYGTPTRLSKPEAAGHFDPSSAKDTTAPSTHYRMGQGLSVPGTAVRTTPIHFEQPIPMEEDDKQDDHHSERLEEEVHVVEVTDFKSSTSEEMLRLYFESFRKSKGGEIETLEKDSKTGAIHIKYSDPTVARAVTKETHKLKGVKLTVKLIDKKKTPPRPVKKRCLLLRGIPDGCSLEHVELYLENCSGMEEPCIKYGEKPGTALCTFKLEIPDLQKVIRKICSKALQKAHVTAEVMHESDCILVQGLTSKMTLEFIELYFDNKKKSGGGGVRDVVPGITEDQAIVYFEDWKVVAEVLSKKGPHMVGGTKVLVEEYHDCLGRLSELDVPTPHIPKPVSLHVPEAIMEYIFGGKGKHTKKKLVAELNKVRALLHWPDGDRKTAARLEPLVEDGQSQTSWLNWSQLCDDVLTGFLKGCSSIKVQVPGSLWKETSVKLTKINATQIFSVVWDDQTHSVQLVGEQQDVDAAAASIKAVIKELQAKADNDAKQIKEKMAMTPDEVCLFTQCGIRHKMEQMFPDMKITVTSFQGQVGLILEGTRKEVHEAELWMRRQMDGLNSVEFQTGKGKTAFLCSVCDKIHEILGSKGINAACIISADGKIQIYGSSKKDTSQAKMYIDQEVKDDVIGINGPAVIAVLKSQDGAQLVAGINKKKFVNVGINFQSGNIELAGFWNELQETKQNILAFLKATVKVKSTIRTNRSKVRLITKFHGQELTGFTTKHQRNHVIIQQLSGGNTGFLVEGNEEGLDSATQFINQLVARIKEKPYPVSKIGMVQRFRETKGKTFLESVEKELECVIDVIGENENGDEEVEGAAASPVLTMTTDVLCRITLSNGCTMRVCKGDLTKQKVDCIVNAANMDLKHIGGLAAAILQAGGQIIQTESDQILKEKGRKLYEAEPVCTSSGNLPCKKVIHVAGPRWPTWKKTMSMSDDQPIHEEHLLFDGVFQCLKIANKLKFQSIAIPAISTGVFGFPIRRAAVQIVNAVVEFSQKVPHTSLTEISLTNHDQPTCDVIKQVTMDQLGHLVEDEPSIVATKGADGIQIPVVEPAVIPPKFTSSGPNILTTNEGVVITLKKGNITEEKADVIVNTSGSDLNLSVGLVSQALLKTAGPALQQECDLAIATRGKVASGSFIDTGAAAMTNCKKIFHCVIDRYHSNASEKPLGTLVESLLEQAEIIEVFSLAIPALGTGNLGYPADVTARVMYEAVAAFSSKHPSGVLKDIRFVVYDKDLKTVKGFEDEIKRLTTGGTVPALTKRKLKKSTSISAVADGNTYSQIQKDTPGMLQAKIGPVCLQICQGDLVKEKSNAIVNSVGEKLDLQGPVSTALLAEGGKKIRKECDALRKKDPMKLVYVTTAGKLQCDSIFHVVTPKTPEEIKNIVTKTLQEAEGKQVQSISFPALGTGLQRQAVGPSASAMLAAIGEFVCQEKPRHLLLVRLVVFKPEMLTGFEAALKQEEGCSYKKQASLLSRGIGWAKSFLPGATAADASDEEPQQETILLHICAMDNITIQRATDKIDRYQAEEFTSEDMPDILGMIAKMTEENHAELQNIERKNNVTIELSKGHAQFFRIQGLTVNVKEARFSIQEMFTRMQFQETKKQRSEHLTKEVQWKYSTPTGVEDYDVDINVIIEEAYQKKQPSVNIELEEGRVTIDFSKMQELSRAGALSVTRVDLQQAAVLETPSSWIPMKKGEHLQLVKLAAGTQEYTDVETRFRTSVGSQAPVNQIDEILRIQNKDLMLQYQARKAALEARLGRPDIEETLYHGTDEQTCDKINKFGFNRSFCGKNATVHGNGTYFAAEASFSARSIYAQPNASNTKHIYATKVLVGDFTTGAQGMVVPPNKPNNPDQLYDCVVDNVAKPSIYVVFHDAQAYPEHLIKFK